MSSQPLSCTQQCSQILTPIPVISLTSRIYQLWETDAKGLKTEHGYGLCTEDHWDKLPLTHQSFSLLRNPQWVIPKGWFKPLGKLFWWAISIPELIHYYRNSWSHVDGPQQQFYDSIKTNRLWIVHALWKVNFKDFHQIKSPDNTTSYPLKKRKIVKISRRARHQTTFFKHNHIRFSVYPGDICVFIRTMLSGKEIFAVLFVGSFVTTETGFAPDIFLVPSGFSCKF